MAGMEISRKAGWDCLRISTGRANAVGPDFLAEMRAALEELSRCEPDGVARSDLDRFRTDDVYQLGFKVSQIGLPLPPAACALVRSAFPAVSPRLELTLTGEVFTPAEAAAILKEQMKDRLYDERRRRPDHALFLDSWFSPETRDRIARAVVRLAGERGT